MKKTLLPAAALAALLFATPAAALELHDARTGGMIGEKADGYVTALKPAADVNALVDSVNSRRRAEYEKISKQNGQPVNVVGQVAAEQIINGLPAGASYQAPDGSWKKR